MLDTLNSRQRDPHEKRRSYENFVQSQYTSQQNSENNDRQLDQIIAGLSNRQRERLFELAGELLHCTFKLLPTDSDNMLSPYYVDMDGQNVKFGSSGTRLLLTLLGTLLDTEYSEILIDEPEIGLNPKIQTVLAKSLYDINYRQKYFPHLQRLFVATHSHIFLDRDNITNNFVVEKKTGQDVEVRQIRSMAELHGLQFGMLGNDLEALFLPSGIIVVEGESDTTFLSRVLQRHLPDQRITIVVSFGDGEVKDKVHTLTKAFGDLSTSPYRTRLFVLLDAVRSVRRAQLERQGVLPGNIHISSFNGIEYYYPRPILAKIFHRSPSDFDDLDLTQDRISIGDLSYSKKELAQLVAEQLTAEEPLHPELITFLEKLRTSC